MIMSDASTIQAEPVMREEEFQNARIDRPYYLRPTTQGIEVIKIPPQWTWQIEPVKRVLACLTLSKNWDSYEGKPASLDTAEFVIKFIDQMPANTSVIPQVIPLSTGGIQLELSRGRKALEIEFAPNGQIYYLESEGDVDREGRAILSQEQITSWMNWLSIA